MAREALAAAGRGEPLPPRLLYDAGELRAVRKLQSVAAVERREIGGTS